MSDSLSSKLIHTLDPLRDHLYTLALAQSESPAKAELTLQKAVRELVPAFAADPYLDIPITLEQKLSPSAPSDPAAPVQTAMPADLWARLAAAVQLEAAKLGTAPAHGHALNPDSVLLSPDPLLAPKKSTPPDDDYDLSPPSRFMLAAGIALCIGIALTIYILTRPTAPKFSSTTHPAIAPATRPGT